MKVFIDTNVLIAAYISHGVCHDFFDHCLDKHVVYSSDFVRQELLEKLSGKLHIPEEKIRRIYTHLCAHSIDTPEDNLPDKISRDPDDDHILAASIHAGVDCIVTGDDDLLVHKKFQGIPIVSPRDFWKLEILK